MNASERDARSLAATILAYWRARGHNPEVWTERVWASSSPTETRMVDVIRSDMVGGWPKPAPAEVVPSPAPKLLPDSKSDSARPFAALAAIRQRPTMIESVGPSVPLWGETCGRQAL